MAKDVSKTQLDRLGDRLKKGDMSEADLRLLDLYRRSFSDAYEIVVGTIRKELSLEPTGRPAKSTTSIIEKLRRESIRLTQIQDIAGCRLTVPGIVEQDNIVRALTDRFERTTIVDRRQQPSHGYRAVHVVVNYDGKMIEIQVRTVLQHLWAELSEKFSDVVDPAIKYGGGNKNIQTLLTVCSSLVADERWLERRLTDVQELFVLNHWLPNEEKHRLVDLQEKLESLRQETFQNLRDAVKLVEKVKGEK